MLIRKIFIGTIVFAIVTTGQLFAQSQPKKSKKNTGHETPSPAVEKDKNTLLFPDFLHHSAIKTGDTTFDYKYYDKDANEIYMYNLKDIDQIEHVKYFKIFSQPSTGKNNTISAPIEYMLQYEYIHPAHDIWLRYDRTVGEVIKYNIFKNNIVATDSVTITDPQTKNKLNFIYKYFKTEIKSKETGQERVH